MYLYYVWGRRGDLVRDPQPLADKVTVEEGGERRRGEKRWKKEGRKGRMKGGLRRGAGLGRSRFLFEYCSVLSVELDLLLCIGSFTLFVGDKGGKRR